MRARLHSPPPPNWLIGACLVQRFDCLLWLCGTTYRLQDREDRTWRRKRSLVAALESFELYRAEMAAAAAAAPAAVAGHASHHAGPTGTAAAAAAAAAGEAAAAPEGLVEQRWAALSDLEAGQPADD